MRKRCARALTAVRTTLSTVRSRLGSIRQVLREQDEWLSANHQSIDAKIRRDMAQLDRGEGVPDDELDDRLERLKAQPE